MLTTLKNAWGITELRKKILFTLLVLLLYRIGNVIPVPYINVDALRSYYDAVLSTTILGLYNAMSGSAFSQATVLALSIQPDNTQTRGKIAKIGYLLQVTEVE